MAEIQITTTQNVSISFKAAEAGERISAYLLDILIKYSYLSILTYLVYLFLTNIGSSFSLLFETDQWSIVALIILLCSPVIFYTLVMESLFSGQTLGKKMMKIQVVKVDGYQASFLDFFIRWSMRIIDITIPPILPGIIAFLCVFNSKKHQRFGGMASGTGVITLRNKVKINHTILEELDKNYKPMYPSVIKLSDNDVRLIKEFYTNALKTRNQESLLKVKNKIISVTSIEPKGNQSSSQFVESILKDYNYYTGK